MTAAKKAYVAPCPRCESTGRHQGGRCYQCHGRAYITCKSSKVMKTYEHFITIDGIRNRFITWGRDRDEAIHVARVWLTAKGYIKP